MLGADGGRNPTKLDGIVPQICSELFRKFATNNKKGETEYQVAGALVTSRPLHALGSSPTPQPPNSYPTATHSPSLARR